LTDDEAKKDRMPKRLFREMLSSDDEVEDDDEELESARARRRWEWECIEAGSATAAEAAAAAAAASCSLECRRSARRRRVLSGLRRRGSRIILGGSRQASQFLHGSFIGFECNSNIHAICDRVSVNLKCVGVALRFREGCDFSSLTAFVVWF
jgi:hypothetical protein